MTARHAPFGRTLLLLAAVAALAAALLLAVGARPAQAATTITVNTRAGKAVDNKCSLAEAIEAANTDTAVDACPAGSGDDTINIAVPGVIRAPRDGFTITSNVVVQGVVVQGNARGTVIEGSLVDNRRAAFKIVSTSWRTTNVASATAVKLADLTIVDAYHGIWVSDAASSSLNTAYSITLENLDIGRSRFHGVWHNRRASSGRPSKLLIKDSVIRQSASRGVYSSSFAYNGCDEEVNARISIVIANSSILHNRWGLDTLCKHNVSLVDSAVVYNSSTGVSHRTGEGMNDLVEIRNSTVANNGTPAAWPMTQGSGISVSYGARLRVANSTIAGNAIAGINLGSSALGGTLFIVNSAVVGGILGPCALIPSAIIGNTGNASSDSRCGFAYGNISPRLGPLRDNGGSRPIGPNGSKGNVLTMAIDASSPLFNAGEAETCQEKDGRGVARPQGSGCDIGAYEAESVTIGDYVWEDSDGDGVEDSDEDPIAGVPLTLVAGDGHVVSETTTDASGRYGFSASAGMWTVRTDHPGGTAAGCRLAAPRSGSTRVDVGDADALGFDFACRGSVKVGDRVWLDADGDGVQDSDEDPIAGVVVELVAGDGDVVGSATTDSDGEYSFRVLPGEWTVRVTDTGKVLSGRRATTPRSLTLPVSAGGAANSSFDFGFESSAGAGDPVINVNTLDGKANDGLCSLAEALEAAETDSTVDGCLAGSGDDTISIRLPDNTTDGQTKTITAPAKGFRVASNVTVQGHADGTTVNGGGGFDVVVTEEASPDTAAATTVTLADLTVTGASGPGVDVVDHAGTALTTAYSVTLENLNIGNSTGRGVSVTRPSGSARPGRVHVKDSVIDGNAAGVRVVACDPTPGDVSLTVTNSIIRGNRSSGVYSSCGRLKVVDSAITANEGLSAAGVNAYYSGRQTRAGNAAAADVEIVNTTIAGNEAVLLGGGVIVSKSGAVRPRLSIVNSTITDNTSLLVGGVRTVGSVGTSIVNSVVAGNSGAECSFGSPPTENTGNASSDDSCGSGLVEDDFGLGDLDDNGGAAVVGPEGGSQKVLTMAIGASSPLFGAGDNTACPEKDARGVTRPQASKCDVGAYEATAVEIGDRVWEDVNNDGEQDPGEPGVGGVTLNLVDPDDEVIDTTTTDEDGEYSFDVTPGSWRVVVTDTGDVLTGHEAVDGESVAGRAAVGGAGLSDFDFGYAPLISIGDLVWVDADGDQAQGAGETGIEGVVVEADDGDGDVRTATTDKHGAYSIRVTPGTWTVAVTDTAGVLDRYRASTPTSVELDVTVGGADISGFDFGYQQLAVIGDLVWDDTNGDGMQDDDETGVEGVTVELTAAAGDPLTATTDDKGGYRFEELPGEWTVAVTDTAGVLSGRRATTPSSLTLEVTVEGAAASNFDFGYTADAGDRVINVNTLDGKARDGLCSFAEALKASETDTVVDGCLAGSGDDEVRVRAPGVIDAPAGGFKITSNVTVQGHADGTTVSGGGGFRVVLTEEASPDTAAATTVTLADLTVTGARGSGVAIVDHAGTALTEGYEVRLTGLRVHRVARVRGAEGRGVSFVKAFDSARVGTVDVEDSVVEHNPGAGVYVDACDAADDDGLGLTVKGSVIRGNDSGGVVNACGRLKVEGSTVTGNTAALGGGVHAHAGKWRDRVGRSGSTASTETVIINSTIADNSATTSGGGVLISRSSPSAPSPFAPSLSILNSTIADNTSPLNNGAQTGGVQTNGPVDVSIVNSAVAGNSGSQCSFAAAPTTSTANASSDNSCGFALVEDGLGLGDLADNGGAAAVGPNDSLGNVLTMAIGVSSPLFGAGDNTACPEKDARGVTRPQASTCDVGAYEATAVKIGDRVWEDVNNDGEQDPGESSLPGVTLDLVDSDDEVIRSTETDEDGEYSFDATPGEWTVRVTDTDDVLDGYEASTPTSVELDVTAVGAGILGFDFGYAPLVSIGDLVWVDADGDQEKDAGEAGIEGVVVEADDGDGDVRTATTDEHGAYTIRVTPGEWTVRVTDTDDVLDGYGASTPTSVELDVTVGGTDILGFDFGYQRLVRIGDLVWDDADGDGMKGDTEPGIAGVVVELTAAGERRTETTNSAGGYSFDVAPGEWTITVTDTAGVLSARRATTPPSLTLEVTAGSSVASNYDFGYTADAGDRVVNVNKLAGGTDGRCSLAEALKAAEADEVVDGCLAGSGDDEIRIRLPGVIRAPGGGFQITSNVTVKGNASGTTVSGGGGVGVVLTEESVTTAKLVDLTVTGARGPGVEIRDDSDETADTGYAVVLENLHVKDNSGAGVELEKSFDSGRGGTVKIANSVLEDNDSAGAYMDACAPTSEVTLIVVNSVVSENLGGGVRNVCGHLKVVDSLIGENVGMRGGVYADEGRSNAEGVKAPTVTEVVNTTIVGNISMTRGGGVAVSGSDTTKLKVANATITGNRSLGGDVDGVHVDGPADVSITNTVVADNHTGTQCSFSKAPTTREGNASSDKSCGFGLEDITSGLMRAADNGGGALTGPRGGNGNVHTMAIDSTSPLHDAGHAASCQATDARGEPRPTGGAGCDIGAYEAQ